MKDETIKSWKDWAVLTWKDIEDVKDDIKEIKVDVKELRKELKDEIIIREKLEKDYIKLKAQIYIVGFIIILIIGAIEISINVLGK